jgi:hypothetical protein
LTIRSPWLTYAGLLLTSGLLGFPWLVLMMRDVNTIARRRLFPTMRVAVGFAIVLAVYLVLLVLLFVLPLGDPVARWTLRAILALAVALLSSILVSLVCLARKIAAVQDTEFGLADIIKTVVLTIPFFLSFPVLQRRINALSGQRVAP